MAGGTGRDNAPEWLILPKSGTTTGMQAHSDNLQGKNQLNCNIALEKRVKQPTC